MKPKIEINTDDDSVKAQARISKKESVKRSKMELNADDNTVKTQAPVRRRRLVLHGVKSTKSLNNADEMPAEQIMGERGYCRRCGAYCLLEKSINKGESSVEHGRATWPPHPQREVYCGPARRRSWPFDKHPRRVVSTLWMSAALQSEMP
eukprot:7657960-Heterocapsa_arctica.AAC.1